MLLGGGELVVPEIQALDGVFLALRRDVAAAIAFDAGVFDGFHLYDLDYRFRPYQAGFRLAVCCDIVIVHDSVGRYDARWTEYKRRFEARHRASRYALGQYFLPVAQTMPVPTAAVHWA